MEIIESGRKRNSRGFVKKLSTVNRRIRSESLPIAELVPHQNTCRGVKSFDEMQKMEDNKILDMKDIYSQQLPPCTRFPVLEESI